MVGALTGQCSNVHGHACRDLCVGILQLCGLRLVVTALMTLARRPIQQSYARTVADLSLSQRSQAVRALRRDEVPADPAVADR
jgi:hypothetical protein